MLTVVQINALSLSTQNNEVLDKETHVIGTFDSSAST